MALLPMGLSGPAFMLSGRKAVKEQWVRGRVGGQSAAIKALATAVSVLAMSAPAAAENLLHQALGAPDNLIITGSFRSRFDAIAGQFRPEPFAASDAMVSLRFVLFAEYDAGPVRIGAEFNDARAYLHGDRSSVSNGEVNTFNLAQVYLGFDLGDALGDGTTTTITAGRTTIDFGSRRLLARNQFRNTVNTFSGVQLDWRGSGAAPDTATLFWNMPVTRLPRDPRDVADNSFEVDRQSLDLQFFGAGYTRHGVLGGTAQFYTMALLERDGDAAPSLDRRLLTTGVRLFRAAGAGHFDHDAELIYQFGRRSPSFDAASEPADVSAWFLHLEGGYSFVAPWSPRLAVQLDYATGNRRDTATFTAFDPLFGARRGELGPTSLYGLLGRSNLVSPALRLEVTPDARWDGFIAWRPAWLESATGVFAFSGVRDPTGAAGRWAGHQIEARARYWLLPGRVRLDGGVAYFAKAAFFTVAPNGRDDGDTRYGYLDITFLF